MVWTDSRRISRALRYSGVKTRMLGNFSFTRLSLSMAVLSRTVQLRDLTATLKTAFFRHFYPTTPTTQRTQAITCYEFGLFPFRSPLLRESLRFLFLALLRCFSSGRSPSYPMYSDMNTLVFLRWVAPFGYPRIKAWLTAPRSLWQSSASFIASWYQGIHQVPFSINHKFEINSGWIWATFLYSI